LYEPDCIWLGAHAVNDEAVLPESIAPLEVNTTLFELVERTKFTEVAPVNWAPVMSISLVDGHAIVVDVDAFSEMIDGTGGSNAQLSTVNVVPHDELPSGEQLDAEIVLGKSSKSTTAWRKGSA
jgi:hypothetical protein